MTCPNCKCQKCRDASKADLNAVLARRVVSHETESPRDLPFVDQHNAAVLRDNRVRESWRDTYGERADYEYHRVPLKSPAGAGESGPNGL